MSRVGSAMAPMGPNEVEVIGSPGELVNLSGQPAALEALTRAEIDTQIATAKRFPRSPARFLAEARSMVAIDPDLAAKCTYVLPRKAKGEDGKEKKISGPSVRLAEIVAVCWGNLRVAGRIVEDDGRSVTAQGVAIDLERNVGYSLEVRRGVTYKNGGRFSDDMVNVTCNAAIAIVSRNVTFKAVPRAFVSLIHEEAQAVARGDVKSLPDRTARALAWFAGQGVPEAEVFRVLEVNGQADMTLDDLATLNGYRTAISEGHATVEEIFRPEAPLEAKAARKGSEGLSERLGAAPKAEAPKTPPAPREREPGEDG